MNGKTGAPLSANGFDLHIVVKHDDAQHKRLNVNRYYKLKQVLMPAYEHGIPIKQFTFDYRDAGKRQFVDPAYSEFFLEQAVEINLEETEDIRDYHGNEPIGKVINLFDYDVQQLSEGKKVPVNKQEDSQ